MIYLVAGYVVVAVLALGLGWWCRGAYWRIFLVRTIRRLRAERSNRQQVPFEVALPPAIVTHIQHEIRPGAAVSVVGFGAFGAGAKCGP
jgi:prepilin signal peptidase PulO-like enzyme (type II secretory pathway)